MNANHLSISTSNTVSRQESYLNRTTQIQYSTRLICSLRRLCEACLDLTLSLVVLTMKPSTNHSRSFRPATLILTTVVGMTFLYFFVLLQAPSPLSKRLNTGVPLSSTIKKYNLNKVGASAKALERKERVLILTPIAKFYDEYWKNLLKLTYPHDLIDLGFIVPRGPAANVVLHQLEDAVAKVQTGHEKYRFGSVSILRQDFETTTGQSEKERHAREAQKERRSALALARNELLLSTLGPSTSWVLHLDADITETPHTLVEDMTSQNRDILIPNCYQRYTDQNGVEQQRPYDFNSWHESQTALDMAASMGEDEIILEGYADMATYRSLMAYEVSLTEPPYTSTRTVQVDGVGGTALLVKADVHRDGAMFPNFPFYRMIETEGFAKMAKRLGYQSWGMPDYLVYHYNE